MGSKGTNHAIVIPISRKPKEIQNKHHTVFVAKVVCQLNKVVLFRSCVGNSVQEILPSGRQLVYAYPNCPVCHRGAADNLSQRSVAHTLVSLQ